MLRITPLAPALASLPAKAGQCPSSDDAGCGHPEDFPPQVWPVLADSLGLSRRELQLTRRVFLNRTDHAIATELGISRHTVHALMGRLHLKLRVKDRIELVLRVVQEFLRQTTAPDGLLASICRVRTAGLCPLCGHGQRAKRKVSRRPRGKSRRKS